MSTQEKEEVYHLVNFRKGGGNLRKGGGARLTLAEVDGVLPVEEWVHLLQGSGFIVQGSGFRVQSSGFKFQGLGSRVQGSGFRV